MPSCFTLTRKGETELAKLNAVDAHMCAHFGVECHPTEWYQNWYNWEGLALACGRDWDWMRTNDPERSAIVDFLAEHYESDAFYSSR